jgi:tetratricopeptide (TPR) repeat protein
MLENIAIIIAVIFCEIYLFLVIRALFSSRSQGHQFSQFKNLDTAIARFSKTIRKNPRDIKSYLARSSAYIQQERLTEALADCDMVTLLEPDNPYAFLNRGAIYGLQNEHEKCIDETTRCLELKPDTLDALINRAHTYARLGNIDAALSDFARIIELAPRNPEHYFERGNCFLHLQKYPEAIADYTHALQQRDKTWEYYYRWNCYMNRGFAHTKLGQLKQAREDFDLALKHSLFHEAIRLDPEDLDNYLQRGNLYYCAEQYQNALRDFLYFQEHKPLHPEQLAILGFCYLKLGEVQQAKTILRQAEERNVYSAAINQSPGDPDNYLNRGVLRFNLEEYQSTIEDLTHALKLGEKSAELLPARGFAYAKLGQYELAQQDFETAISNNPDSPTAYYCLAWMLATCPEPRYRNGPRALELAHRNLELLPEINWNALSLLAAASAESGNFEDAIKWITQAMELAQNEDQTDCEKQLHCYERYEAYTDLDS